MRAATMDRRIAMLSSTFSCVLLMAAVAAAEAAASLTFRDSPPPGCLQASLPDGLAEWQANAGGSSVSVEWGYGNTTCSSASACHGIATEPDTELEAQLMPVQLQQGVRLKFFGNPGLIPLLSFMPFKVDERGFRECDTSQGTPVSPEHTTAEVLVSPALLQPGANYFVANTTDPLYECRFGLRLNVTVKTSKCAGPGEQVRCWSKGRCVTDVHNPLYTCACCRGWTGQFCGDRDGCEGRPCQNGGSCTDVHADVPGEKSFTCACPTGYFGERCEKVVENLCTESVCQNNGTCVSNENMYNCLCPPGYTGHHCEVDTNDCEPNPCPNGLCMDKVGGYQCFCRPGWGGKNCDRQYNECESSPCRNGGFCVDKTDSFRCECEMGYTGHDCSVKVDLCSNGYCQNATECVDFGHTFGCTCNPGYDGSHCEVNVNECLSNPCLNGGRCYDEVAGYRCVCPRGHTGLHCEYSFQSPPGKQQHGGGGGYATHMHRDHITNLYIIAGTLGGALLIALLVLLCCYCRVNETYRAVWPIRRRRNKGYERHQDPRASLRTRGSSHKIDLPTSIDGHPSPEAIAATTSSDYRDGGGMNAPLVDSLKAKRV